MNEAPSFSSHEIKKQLGNIPRGNHELITDPEKIASFGEDRSRRGPYLPDGVIILREEKDLPEILTFCSAHRIPVTVQGGRTTPTAASLPLFGGLVLAFSSVTEVTDFNPIDLTATVKPAMTLANLQDWALREGCFFPVDSGSRDSAQMGGVLGNNTAGKWAFKYGQFHHHLLSARVVLATGETIRVGAQVRKNATAFTLTPLMAGSQGMLGIVTEMTVGLLPKPECTRTLLCFYRSFSEFDRALAKILRAPRKPRALEMMDRTSLERTTFFPEAKAILSSWQLPRESQVALLIEEEGTEQEIQVALETVWWPLLEATKAENILVGETEAKERELWKIRDLIPTAFDHLGRFMTTDFVVPRRDIGKMLTFIQKRRDHYALDTGVFGHAGDGNFHVNIIAKTEEEKGRAVQFSGELHTFAIQLGGAISGEHNAGLVKAKYARWQLGQDQIELSKRIKQAFDPQGILNPGKLFYDKTEIPPELTQLPYRHIATCSGE